MFLGWNQYCHTPHALISSSTKFIAAIGMEPPVSPETIQVIETTQNKHEAPGRGAAAKIEGDKRGGEHRADGGDPFKRSIHGAMSAPRGIGFLPPAKQGGQGGAVGPSLSVPCPLPSLEFRNQRTSNPTGSHSDVNRCDDQSASVSRFTCASESSSRVNSSSVSSWSTVRALAIGAGMPGWRTSHASAMAGRLAPVSAATSSIAASTGGPASGVILHPVGAVALLEIVRLAVFAGQVTRSEAEERQHGDTARGAKLLQVRAIGIARDKIVLVLQAL